MGKISLTSSKRFINRELSWLEFNERVLDEAVNEAQPLFERLRFLSISDSNLKEFYMVRVAGLKGQVSAGVTEPSNDGMTPAQQLEEINERAKQQILRQSEAWQNITEELGKAGIKLVKAGVLGGEDKKWLDAYFLKQIFPILTPLAVDPAHPFPFIPNLGFAMVMRLEEEGSDKQMMALLPLPSHNPRFIRLPDKGKTIRYVVLEDLISCFFKRIFPGFRVREHGVFNIIRDSEVEVKEDAEDLVRSYESALKKRRRGNVIRLIMNKGISKYLKRFVVQRLEVDEQDVFERESLLSLKDVIELITPDRPDLLYVPFNPRFPERIRDFGGDCFSAIRNKDIIVHHPYESFDVVVQFLLQAARDPDVLTIKQTLYRTSEDSPIVRALIEAAESGKSVTALVELAARFDEEANIRWARDMERAGVQVVYGFFNLKTHAKMSMVVRREEDRLQSYVHFGTGNYHPLTAKIYTDLSFFTCDGRYCRDVARLFNYLTGYATPDKTEVVSYSPNQMREKITALIENEIKHVKAGHPGHIWAKMNSLIDPVIIDLLYKASQAGVKIDLVVRGICGLRPGVKGLSENISVKSIVGRFLEHSRILCFGNGAELPSDKALVFMSSADWMPRNFGWRVEVLVPLENATVRQQVMEQIMLANLIDNTQSWMMQPDGSYKRVKPGKQPFSAHQYFMENPSLSGRGSAALNTRSLPPKLKLEESS